MIMKEWGRLWIELAENEIFVSLPGTTWRDVLQAARLASTSREEYP